MNSDTVSIIIPAHNEERVIERTLGNHQEGITPGFEIIVVCNGCTDNTANLVSKYGSVKLLVTETASKTYALNKGDEIATGKCRVYMDADVVMTIGGLKSMMMDMNRKGVLAITPNVKMDYSNASRFVKTYYKFWLQLPYVREGFIGGGVYMLSDQGRSRFCEFPNIISDDGYVRSLFSNEEISRSDNIFSVVSAPGTIVGLIKIFTRSRVGQYQLFAMYPESQSQLRNNPGRTWILLNHLIRPKNLVGGLTYIIVNFLCRIRARAQFAQIDNYVWETDISSRS